MQVNIKEDVDYLYRQCGLSEKEDYSVKNKINNSKINNCLNSCGLRLKQMQTPIWVNNVKNK